MRAIAPADLIGTSPVFLLDLQWGGQVYRVASEAVDVTATDGSTLSYAPGLTVPRIERSLGRLRVDPGDLEAAIRCVLPVHVARRRREGHDLMRATADLYMVAVRDSERRLTVPTALQAERQRWHLVSGDVRSPTYAVPGEPAGFLEFTLRSQPWEGVAPLVNPTHVISAETWSTAEESVHGKRYPTVIGRPGVTTDSTGTAITAAGSPAYVVKRTTGSADTLLIAGHLCAAGSVTVIDEDGTTEAFAVTYKDDDLGARVAVCDVSSAASIDRTDSTFWVAWTGEGGVIDPFVGGTLERAEHVIPWAMQLRGDLPVDVPAWLALVGRVPSILVATYVNDASTPWEWLARHVLPLLPISPLRGPQGAYPVVWARSGTTADVVAIVEAAAEEPATPGVWASTGTWVAASGLQSESEPEDLLTALVARYAPDGVSGGYRRSAVVVPSELRAAGESSTLYLQHATSRRVSDPVEVTLDAVWEPASGEAAALWRAQLESLPVESADYLAPWSWGWLRLGQPILLIDEAKALDKVVVPVNRLAWDGTVWSIEVLVEDDQVRQARRVP